MSHLFWLTDIQFERLRPLLPNKMRGVKRVDDRRVISGIIHVIRMACCGATLQRAMARPKPCITALSGGAG